MAAWTARDIPTARLRLLPIGQDDAAAVCGLLQLADVRRYLCDDRLVPPAEIEAWIAEAAGPASATELWRITAAGATVGVVGLQAPTAATLRLRAIGWRSRELIIALDPAHWGRGLAAEAVEAIAVHAGGDGVTFALVGCVDVPNVRSHALMRRCRFAELGRVPGPVHELVVYERAV